MRKSPTVSRSKQVRAIIKKDINKLKTAVKKIVKK